MYKIEKEKHEIPQARWATTKYPFDEMEIGDSFLIPFDGRKPQRIQQSALGCVRAKRYPYKKFGTRIIRKEDSVRVWRIK